MKRHTPSVCQRRGCATRLESWQRVCTPCWGEIPVGDRAAIARLGQERRFGARDEARRAAVRKLGIKGLPTPSASASTQAYATLAARMGERPDEEEAA